MSAAVVSRECLLPGLRGLSQTEQRILVAIRTAAKDPDVIWRARQITSGVPPHDNLGQIKAVFNYLLGAFPYRKDPVDVEYIQAPPALPKGGDCDDYTVQGGAYLEALGHPVEVVVVATKKPRPGQEPRFHHVYLRVLDDNTGQWVPFDPVLHRPLMGKFGAVGQELPHAVERTFRVFNTPMDPQMLGDFDLFAAITGGLKSVGRFFDPSIEGSAGRAIVGGALNLIAPGTGSAALLAIDGAAKAKQAILASQQPQQAVSNPATVGVGDKKLALSTTSASATPAEEPKKGLSTGAKVALGLLGLGAAGGAAAAIIHANKKKKRR